MRIVVVIPFYNEDEIIVPCVASILQGIRVVHRIIIVNNSSIPTQVHALFKSEPKVQIIDTKPSIGYGRANNIGAWEALSENADIVIILNQDAIVFEDTIELLISPFFISKDISISVPLVCAYYKPDKISATYLKMYFAPVEELLSDALLQKKMKPYYPVKHAISGACMAIKAASIRDYGLFEPSIYMYGEDIELFSRYAAYNQQAVLVPAAKISHAHSHGQANGSKLANIKRQIHRNTPYSIWNNPKSRLYIKWKKLLCFLLLEYITLVSKKQWRIFPLFILEDLTLPYRLYKVARHQKIGALLLSTESQMHQDRIDMMLQ